MKKTLFKIQYLGLTLAGLICSNNLSAQNFGQFASAAFMEVNGSPKTFNLSGSGSNLIGPSGEFLPADLGTFVGGAGGLKLLGSEMKTYKDAGANVCGVRFYYGVMVANPAGSNGNWYSSVPLPFKADCSNGSFADGYGPCSGNDQKWGSSSLLWNDLTNRSPGDYELNIYYRIEGSSLSSSDCSEGVYLGYYNTPFKAIFHIKSATAGKGINSDIVSATSFVRSYPSPVTNVLNIEVENFENGPIQMQVTNLQGATSKNIMASYTQGQPMTLDMSSYAAGMYFVRLQQGSEMAMTKVIKQ